MSLMAGSRSRGTARSIRKSGRPFRPRSACSTSAELARDLLRPLQTPSSDEGDPRSPRGEAASRQLADPARADEEHRGRRQIAEDLLGEHRSSRGYGGGALADGGLRPRLLPDVERLPE